jgi:hypothetical protein
VQPLRLQSESPIFDEPSGDPLTDDLDNPLLYRASDGIHTPVFPDDGGSERKKELLKRERLACGSMWYLNFIRLVVLVTYGLHIRVLNHHLSSHCA